ncbi:MAG: 50S ribosomal protein L23 [Deltaproteobacteria bacterium]|nr:MAG: 50S ribosomal protein L23 [Deltaproteobacteria bacterium]
MAELHDILIRPLITEKSTILTDDQNTYVFQVGLQANKIQIKQAIEQVFGVQVEDVRTVTVRGKTKRFGRYYGKRPNWKKAYVRLAEGDALNFFDA